MTNMTISFGSSLPATLNNGDRLTVYFSVNSLNHPSVGYFEVFESSSEWILHSLSDNAYRGLKYESGEWKCLRESSLHAVELIGYSLWIQDFEIHGFFREHGKRDIFFPGFENHGTVLSPEKTSRFVAELPDKGTVTFNVLESNSFSYEIVEDTTDISVEVYEDFTSDQEWFQMFNGGVETDFIRIGMDIKPSLEHGPSNYLIII